MEISLFKLVPWKICFRLALNYILLQKKKNAVEKKSKCPCLLGCEFPTSSSRPKEA